MATKTATKKPVAKPSKEETKKVTSKKPTVNNRLTAANNRKALGSSPLKSDNQVTSEDFAKKIQEAKKKIVWFDALQKTGRNITMDVSIVKGDAKKQKWNFTLRNEYVRMFGKMVQVGNFDNKLFFKEVDSFGYFITVQDRKTKRGKGTSSGYFKLPVCKELEYLEKFVGNHNMQYDELLELYYIEV